MTGGPGGIRTSGARRRRRIDSFPADFGATTLLADSVAVALPTIDIPHHKDFAEKSTIRLIEAMTDDGAGMWARSPQASLLSTVRVLAVLWLVHPPEMCLDLRDKG